MAVEERYFPETTVEEAIHAEAARTNTIIARMALESGVVSIDVAFMASFSFGLRVALQDPAAARQAIAVIDDLMDSDDREHEAEKARQFVRVARRARQ